MRPKLIQSIAIYFVSYLFLTNVQAQDATPVKPSGYTTGINFNYVRTWEAVVPESNVNNINTSTATSNFRMVTQYLDGLGRPIQTVVKQGSQPTGGVATDLVTTNVYDAFGREPRQYLPFIANTTGGNSSTDNGLFKINPFDQQQFFYSDLNTTSPLYGQGETYYYAKTNFESSPLNRPTESYAAGNSWVGSEGTTKKGSKINYSFNTDIDAVRIWSVINNATIGVFGSYNSPGTYPVGTLYKNITTDENNKQVIEFKDKEGKVILKKVQLTGTLDDGLGISHNGWLCTYYIYDDFNLLRCVIQPSGVEFVSGTSWSLTDVTVLAEQCFRYEYDTKQRMIVKKVPGAGEIWMVYDARDRLVMSQDAVMRTALKWQYTLFDILNRPVSSGLMSDNYNASNLLYHLGLSNSRINYPDLTGYSYEELTKTGYDNYSAIPSASGLTSGFDASYASNFSNTSNTYPEYAQPLNPSNQTNSMVTWTQSKILPSTSDFIYTVNIYDDKGRVIQQKSTNITNGKNTITSQYSWSGQLLRTVSEQKIGASASQTNTVVTQFKYDDLGRPTKTQKKVAAYLVNNGVLPSAFTTTSAIEYDNLGQIKKKSLGNKPGASAGTPLAKLEYEYNIRGWLLSINKNYLTSSNADQYFGMQLGYDKNGVYNSFVPQFGGNISGTIWKSEGDQVQRKYDYTYDPVNRLTSAIFTQYVSGGIGTSAIFDNTTANINFNVENLTYDANGNILIMWQKGLLINSSDYIDKLAYSYLPNSNKLNTVIDEVNNFSSKMGDFKYDPNYKLPVDYLYNSNGSLTKDQNKNIRGAGFSPGIYYNNYTLPTMPSRVYVKYKGYIDYVYEASGNKLKKVVSDMPLYGNTVQTTTTYLSEFNYESKTTSPANVPSDDYSDVLQFISHEDGRIRIKPSSGSQAAAAVYDYFIKDHLGNVRAVLTDEVQVSHYPTITLEGTGAGSPVEMEKNYFDVNSAYVVPKPTNPNPAGLLDYVNDNGTNNANTFADKAAVNQKMYQLNASTNRTGLSTILKVMSGDKIDILGKSYYRYNSESITNTPFDASDLINLFLGVAAGANSAVQHGATAGALSSNSTGTVIPLGNFTNNNPTNSNNNIKAGINYIIFDEQFKFVSGGFDPVDNSAIGGLKPHFIQNISIPKNGYIYIYCSNESNINVFFDNLEVVHTRGPILEETHYYPFGLTMAGISSKSASTIENKRKFNKGCELQNKEFGDGSGLELYATNFRSLDPQLGRWLQIDPKPDYSQSLYSEVNNNPISNNDPLGDTLRGANNQIVSYSRKDGNILWKNATEDIERLGNLLLNNSVGTELLDKLISNEKNNSLTIDKTTVKQVEGGTVLGETTPIVTTTTRTRGEKIVSKTKKVTGFEIVIYEKPITQGYKNSNKLTMTFYNRMMTVLGNSLADVIGSVVAHELTHATDKNSQWKTNPGATISEVEKKPLDNQENYLIENLQNTLK